MNSDVLLVALLFVENVDMHGQDNFVLPVDVLYVEMNRACIQSGIHPAASAD